jgi:hypothetical protein
MFGVARGGCEGEIGREGKLFPIFYENHIRKNVFCGDCVCGALYLSAGIPPKNGRIRMRAGS